MNVAAVVLAAVPVISSLGIGNFILCLDKGMGTSTRIGSGVILVLKLTTLILFVHFLTLKDEDDERNTATDRRGSILKNSLKYMIFILSLVGILVLYIVGIVFAATSKKIVK